jgi:hypothetical protein
MFDILAALGLGAGSASSAPAASTTAAAEELFEYGAEVLAVDIEIFDADARATLPG